MRQEDHPRLIVTQVLEADYTAALTLLLRYPVPKSPHGPPTFVSDALYLRDNLLLDGGDHIVSKYSQKSPETTVTRKLPKKIKRARTAEQAAAQTAMQKAVSPRMSPSRYLQEQGGIEGIIQEAAKGVYHQGERWGVTKALRGAVQGLQSGNASPRRASDKARWSLDNGKMVSASPKDLIARIQALEERNKSLAKLLEKAMEELWTQQKQSHETRDETVPDTLSLAVAKVQFVQVYLENPTMPLAAESDPDHVIGEAAAPKSEEKVFASTAPAPVDLDGTVDRNALDMPIVPIETNRPSSPVPRPAKSSPNAPRPTTPSTSHQSRPSLSQSPFSWMLGEEQQKSGFVAVSPFSTEAKDAESGRGSLFGEDVRAKERQRVEGSRNAIDGDGDEDVFTMGSLKSGLK